MIGGFISSFWWVSYLVVSAPLSEIDKVFPETVVQRGKRDLDKRPPLWPLRFAYKANMRLAREPIGPARIARNARADQVFPSFGRAPVALKANVAWLSPTAGTSLSHHWSRLRYQRRTLYTHTLPGRYHRWNQYRCPRSAPS